MLETIRMTVAAARNVLLGTNAAALPLLRRPYQFVHYASEARFLLRALSKERGLPERGLAEAIGGEAPLELTLTPGALTWGDGVGSYSVDIASLVAACRLLQPAVYFEIGTLNGFTAYHAALNSPDSARIYTLDLPPDHSDPALRVTDMDQAHIRTHDRMTRLLFEGTPQERKVTRLFGDSATFDYTPFREQVDVFFIDGAHSYEYVRSDTLKALYCCHPGSVILWHDFGRAGVNGVSRWLTELRALGADVNAVPGGSLAWLRVAADVAGLRQRLGV